MKELSLLAKSAKANGEALNVPGNIHIDDCIFRFLINHPNFKSHHEAISYYFNDGRKSAEKLLDILKNLWPHSHKNLSILEFASGYGCVTRHFPLVIPQAKMIACDIHNEAVSFITDHLGQPAILSHKDPKHFILHEKYDVIFSLSFFSHMPKSTWGQWITAHYKHLKQNGALIFTTHGLSSRSQLGDLTIPQDGFWFKPGSEQLDLDAKEYGITLVTKEFVEKEIYTQIKRPIELYRAGFWWNHQDLYVVRRND